MPNPNGGLGAAGPSMAAQVCGAIVNSSSSESGCSNSYKSIVYSEEVNYNGGIAVYDKYYTFDSCIDTNYMLLPYGMCVEYDKAELTETSGDLALGYRTDKYNLTGVRLVDSYCAYNQKMVIEGSFSACSPCQTDYAGAGGLDVVLDMFITGGSGRGSMHKNTSCDYCVNGMYLSGGSCITCPSPPGEWYNGATIIASSDGQTCFVQAPNDGSDETGSYIYDTGVTINLPSGSIKICYYQQ